MRQLALCLEIGVARRQLIPVYRLDIRVECPGTVGEQSVVS